MKQKHREFLDLIFEKGPYAGNTGDVVATLVDLISEQATELRRHRERRKIYKKTIGEMQTRILYYRDNYFRVLNLLKK
jgi:hypothetical protein